MSNLSTLLQVYLGTLPIGQLIAIKQAQKASMQGGLEFKTEIELLSRVHHKNLVRLVGFCLDQGEQMLVYDVRISALKSYCMMLCMLLCMTLCMT